MDGNYNTLANAKRATTKGRIRADMVNRVVRNFELVFPDTGTTTWSFAALITGFEPGSPSILSCRQTSR